MTYPIYPDQGLLWWTMTHHPSAGLSDQPETASPLAPEQTSLSAPPRSEPPTSGAMQTSRNQAKPVLLVVYESGRGRAERAADAIAATAAAQGMTSVTRPIDDVDAAHLEAANAVIVGCWTPGKVPFGDSPTRATARWIERLPSLEGKPVGVFCTYRFFPHTFADMATRTAETLDQLESRLKLKGGQVAGTKAIHYTSIEQDAATLTERFLQQAAHSPEQLHATAEPAPEEAAHVDTHRARPADGVDSLSSAADNRGAIERTPEAIARRLAEILDELAALPDGPSPERFTLLTEQDSLRSDAASLQATADQGRSVESLLAELASLKKRRKAMVHERGSYVTGHNADSAGRVGASLTRLGSQPTSSPDIERLTARISRIEDILASKQRAQSA